MTTDRISEERLRELIRWHSADGTKKGELTTAALIELLARRSSPDREMVDEAAVERAAKAAVAELKVIAAELDTPFDYVKTISVGNFRVIRAAILAALEAKP
jgi:hypothetical protein